MTPMQRRWFVFGLVTGAVVDIVLSLTWWTR
jgi:hypothetical protein